MAGVSEGVENVGEGVVAPVREEPAEIVAPRCGLASDPRFDSSGNGRALGEPKRLGLLEATVGTGLARMWG